MQAPPGYFVVAQQPNVPVCPHCRAAVAPQLIRKTSALGWVLCIVFVLFCLVGLLFLLMKQTISVCPSCGFTRRMAV